MGGKNDAPPPPDYTPIAKSSEEAAKYSYELGKEQLAWAREQYGKDTAIANRIVDSALERQAVSDETAAKDRARYEQVFQPLETQLAREAESYATPARAEFEAGRAQAAVSQQFDQARQAAAQNLESFGVDPSSTRFAALDAGSRIAQAAAQSAAGTNARLQTEAMGRALRSEAINVGRGYPGQIAQTYGTALQSGNTAINSQLATTASGASTMGTGTQYQGLGNQALGTWGSTLNTGYQNQLAQYQANQQSSSGLGGLLGAGLGLLGSSSNAAGAAGLGMFLSEGGAIPDGMTSGGGGVPSAASPTGGKAIDDVPARLTAGEFVVPKDVVSWKGEEFFQKLIDGSRKAKPEAPAKPQYAALPMQAPTFMSRPQSAFPTR
jgi:hypothetical protein